MQNKVNWRRGLILTALVTLMLWGLFLGFRPQAIEVDLSTIKVAPLSVYLEQEGRTRVVDRYVIHAPVNGYARRIQREVGETVKQGALLVQLEPLRAEVLDARRRAEAEARVDAAEDSVSAAEQRSKAAVSNATLTQKEYQRLHSLHLAGHVSASIDDRAASEAERSVAELQSAQFSVATARHELEAARTALNYGASVTADNPVAVRSPVAGQVLKIPHKSEGTVLAGQPLIEIGNPNVLEVEVDLLTSDAVRIHPGTRVIFERWGGEAALKGVVRMIEPGGFTKISALGVEEQRVWVIVNFTSPHEQWQRLGDGYRVEARFILWEEDNILQIPASALFRDADGWAAFVVEQGKAVKRKIETGQGNGLSVQVISGIKVGEQAIVHPDDRVRQGVAIMAR
jgi:HlyD family secretion protein